MKMQSLVTEKVSLAVGTYGIGTINYQYAIAQEEDEVS